MPEIGPDENFKECACKKAKKNRTKQKRAINCRKNKVFTVVSLFMCVREAKICAIFHLFQIEFRLQFQYCVIRIEYFGDVLQWAAIILNQRYQENTMQLCSHQRIQNGIQQNKSIEE